MRLVQDARFRRREGRALVEGPHLVGAALDRGVELGAILASEGGLARSEIASLIAKSQRSPVVLTDTLFRAVFEVEAPPGLAAEIKIPADAAGDKGHSVFLEGIQDAGNVGAILRSAAAFGVATVVLDRACADPWSPKALRAGMGGHFALQVKEVSNLEEELRAFSGRLLCTVPRQGIALKEADLSGRLGWIFGSEGQGVSRALQEKAVLRIAIPMAAGAESLNVAATAAICLYEVFCR